jgi:divalent metal cation (Fe/Co/Zn/Cd) transporter
MDQSCKEEEGIILNVLEKHKLDYIEFHDLKTRKQGNLVLGEVHLTVHDSMSVRKAHDIIDQIEKDTQKDANHIRLTVHIDPETELQPSTTE